MNYKGYPIGVHIEQNSVKTVTGIVQRDDGNLFQIQLYDGMDAFDFSGYTIINAVLERPDGTKITDLWPVKKPDPADEDTEPEETTATPAEPVETEEPAETPATTSEDEVDDDEPVAHTDLAIQRVDPENGRISLEVGGIATELTGMHRMAIEIYGDSKRLTTARINYNVVASLNDIDLSFLQTQETYTDLQALIENYSNMIEEEQGRVNNEQVREDSEAQRVASFEEMETEYNSMISELTDLLVSAQQAATEARTWADVARQVIYDPTQWPVIPATEDYVDTEIAEVKDHIALRTLTEEEETEIETYRSDDTYLILKKVASNELSSWCAHAIEGEMVYCDGAIYLCNGTTVPALPVATPAYPAVVVGTTAPENTNSVWIDTSDGNQLKFYTSGSWTAIGSVAFFS